MKLVKADLASWHNLQRRTSVGGSSSGAYEGCSIEKSIARRPPRCSTSTILLRGSSKWQRASIGFPRPDQDRQSKASCMSCHCPWSCSMVMGPQTMLVNSPAASAGRLSSATCFRQMLLPHNPVRGQLGRHALLTGWSNSSCGAAVHQPRWKRGTLQVQASSGVATEQGVQAKPSAPSHTLRAKRGRPCRVPDRPVERNTAQDEEVSSRALNMLVRVRTCSVLTLSGSPGAASAICSMPNGQQRPCCSSCISPFS